MTALHGLRLSRGMTYKNAVAGLNLGVGKSVIICENKTLDREMILRAQQRWDAILGEYIPPFDAAQGG